MENQPTKLHDDGYLSPYFRELDARSSYIQDRWRHLRNRLNWHEAYGLHRQADGSWVFREWLPHATAVWLKGTFSAWQLTDEFQLTRTADGVWEGHFPADALAHGDEYGMHVAWCCGSGYRLPSAATRVVRHADSISATGVAFNAQVWEPDAPYCWRNANPNSGNPLIYESHVGMATSEERVGTFAEYTRDILPRIAAGGYNTVQLMGILQHPYYGSFGYHVSNFFAVCDLYGTPEEFKELVDTAHGLGLRVIIDLVHSHAVKNEIEGLGCIDGTDCLYFHSGERGYHTAWGSRCFDYGKDEVLRFLLSNCKFWMEEYHLDGFRFDGVTSMMYWDHGLGHPFTSYADYFTLNTDWDALAYLSMANRVVHGVLPSAWTIAEDVSGMPGLAAPVKDGGLGFDYRLAMGIPDLWFRLADGVPDEAWSMGALWHELNNHRSDERSLSYVECHDQALVGGKTFIFTLADAAMYDSMHISAENLLVERGVALHKMARLLTMGTAGFGYLNFMGNEFGHPEWIDFPREGNNWSYAHARRLWGLRDNPQLRYKQLGDFDQAMMTLTKAADGFFAERPELALCDDARHLLAFWRGRLLFVFNFHPVEPQPHLGLAVREGTYRPVLETDAAAFGGHGLIGDDWQTTAVPTADGAGWQIEVNLPPRTALVLAYNENTSDKTISTTHTHQPKKRKSKK